MSTGSVTTYTWDALNRLTRLDEPSGTHTYGYDPNGIRVRETNDGTTTRFLHVGEDIVASYQGGTVETYYTHGPGIDEPWAQLDPDAATEERLAYLHRDGLGPVTAISHSNPESARQCRGAHDAGRRRRVLAVPSRVRSGPTPVRASEDGGLRADALGMRGAGGSGPAPLSDSAGVGGDGWGVQPRCRATV